VPARARAGQDPPAVVIATLVGLAWDATAGELAELALEGIVR
jgi:hypothetical protein